MRLRADIYVSALVRRVFSAGDFAAVEKKGAEEAGAIFIRQRFRDGLETLYAPAPQSFFDEESSGDRLFEIRLDLILASVLIKRGPLVKGCHSDLPKSPDAGSRRWRKVHRDACPAVRCLVAVLLAMKVPVGVRILGQPGEFERLSRPPSPRRIRSRTART